MTSENGVMYMPVAPAYGNGNGMFGSGDGAWWLIVLFLFAMNGGWGNGFGANNGAGAGMQRGFDQQAVMSGIGDITGAISNGFANVQTALCGGFAGVNAGVSNGFAQAEIANNGRQMANMNQLNSLSMGLQNCCCENRAATADLKYTVATEACADRAAVTNALQEVTAQGVANTQNVLNAINGGFQSIRDQLFSDKMDAKNERIAELERQLTMANFVASQGHQTSQIISSLAPIPVPAYVVPNPNVATAA